MAATKEEVDVEDLGQHAARHRLPSDDDAVRMQQCLLAWYDEHRRRLPWRGDPEPFGVTVHAWKREAGAPATSEAATASAVDPYATWVSEIMCQQTRIDTVLAYFVRWMVAFPTIQALADATPDDVNKMWAGLGYYRRAKLLHAGARKVVADFGGKLPTTFDQLKQVPGIGPYTAAAIASISANEAVPAIDGNAIRVYSRLFAVAADPTYKPLLQFCWNAGRVMISRDRAGDFNQAIMELGASLCSPTAPACGECPLQRWCKATTIRSGVPTDCACTTCDVQREEARLSPASAAHFPLKKKKAPPKQHQVFARVIMRGTPTKEVLLCKRPDGGLLAGQWGPVTVEVTEDMDDEDAPDIDAACAKVGITAFPTSCVQRTAEPVTHVFTHIVHTIHTQVWIVPDDDWCSHLDSETVKWCSVDEVTSMGLTTWATKVLQAAYQCVDSLSRTVLDHKPPKRAAKAIKSESSKRKAAAEANTKPISSFFNVVDIKKQ